MLFILGLLISPVLFLVRLNYKKKIIKIWSKYILKFLAIKIYTNLDLEKFTKSKNFLIVCNHVSWLDIILINSLSPVSFIATKEIKFWPLINILTFAANTIFIDRKSLSNLKKINLKIKQALKKIVFVFSLRVEQARARQSYLLKQIYLNLQLMALIRYCQ